MLDPALKANQGVIDTIEIVAPEGTIVNPRHPAAVGARSITANKIARAIIAALGQMLPPERGFASGQDIVPGLCFSGHRQRGGDYVYLETIGGGSGAGAGVDGMDGVQVHVTNTSNLPVEALENEYRLLVEEYALVEDSCGGGSFRGGLGIARQIRATEDGVVFSARSDGHVRPAPGLRGGNDGRVARLVLNPGRAGERTLDSKSSGIVLAAGDTVRIETPGGGGLGLPADRADRLIVADIEAGKTSLEYAVATYGADRMRRLMSPS
jgi:N-methylhydantoinase B